MEKIKINILDGRSGDWAVETFVVTKDGARMHNMRCAFSPGMGHRMIEPGTYKKLTRNGEIIMSNTPAEIFDHSYFTQVAKGTILINGLGLGVVLEMLLQKPGVNHITVIEKSEDVIKLVGTHYKANPKITIICADAFAWKPLKGVRYDFVWHDIWDNICGDNLPEMTRLHRKYGRRTSWQGSWCRELCRR